MDDVRIEAAAKALHSFSMSTLPLEEAPATFRREQMRRAEAMLKAADAVDPLRNPWIIETVEGLDSLLDGTLILTEQGGYWEASEWRGRGRNWWKEPGRREVSRSEDLALPAIVLPAPEFP